MYQSIINWGNYNNGKLNINFILTNSLYKVMNGTNDWSYCQSNKNNGSGFIGCGFDVSDFENIEYNGMEYTLNVSTRATFDPTQLPTLHQHYVEQLDIVSMYFIKFQQE